LVAGFAIGLTTDLAWLFGSALRAEALAPPDPDAFDLATIFSVVFLDFAAALAMTDNNPIEERRLAPYTILRGSAQAAKPRRSALHVKHPEKAEAVQTDQDQIDRDDEIQEPRHDQDQDASEQSYNGGNMRSGDGH
jgi:cytosine/adenosine deaminase-related metal-dependent hydrolase